MGNPLVRTARDCSFEVKNSSTVSRNNIWMTNFSRILHRIPLCFRGIPEYSRYSWFQARHAELPCNQWHTAVCNVKQTSHWVTWRCVLTTGMIAECWMLLGLPLQVSSRSVEDDRLARRQRKLLPSAPTARQQYVHQQLTLTNSIGIGTRTTKQPHLSATV